MRREAGAILVMLLVLTVPAVSNAGNQSMFSGSVTFKVIREKPGQDREALTEQAVVARFKEALEPDIENMNVKIDSGRVSIDMYSMKKDLRVAFKKGIADAMKAETPCPVKLVRQSIRMRRQEVRVEEGEQYLDQDGWERAWEKSMRRLQKNMRRTVDHSLRRAIRHLDRMNARTFDPFMGDDDEDEDDEDDGTGLKSFGALRSPGGARPARIGRAAARLRRRGARSTRRRRSKATRGPIDVATSRGTFKILVDKEKNKVLRLLAYDGQLGMILTRLASQLPVNYILDSDKLASIRVTVSLSDTGPPQIMQALARASGTKLTEKDGLFVFSLR